MNSPKFIIQKSKDNQFFFVLKAPNHETIAVSEMYTTKAACHNGIESIAINAPIADTIDRT